MIRFACVLAASLSLAPTALAQTFVTVPGVAFHADDFSVDGALHLANGAVSPASITDAFLMAPVTLPHGLTITHFGCTLLDNDPSGYIQVSLLRTPMDPATAGADETIAFIGTFPVTVSPAWSRPLGLPTLTPGAELIDNASYAYYIRLDLLAPSSLSGLSVAGCSIRAR